MRRVKRRTFSGVVCEQEIYDIPEKLKMRVLRNRDLKPKKSGSSIN